MRCARHHARATCANQERCRTAGAARRDPLREEEEGRWSSALVRALLELTLEENSVVRFLRMHVAHDAAVSVAERRIVSTQARTHE